MTSGVPGGGAAPGITMGVPGGGDAPGITIGVPGGGLAPGIAAGVPAGGVSAAARRLFASRIRAARSAAVAAFAPTVVGC